MDVYISLGSNLHQPIEQINTAIAQLKKLPDSQHIKTSALYQTKPILHPDNPNPQEDYINAVVWLNTTLDAYNLLQKLQAIEAQQGRIRGVLPWSARTLDLDIILYGNKVSNDPLLTLPHPRMTARLFVLYPLFDCNPDLILPHQQHLADYLPASMDKAVLQRLHD